MPRSLGGRLIAAFAILAVATLLAVGGTLFVVLRGLNQDATFAALANVAGSVLPQVRDSVGSGDLRGTIEEVREPARRAEHPGRDRRRGRPASPDCRDADHRSP